MKVGFVYRPLEGLRKKIINQTNPLYIVSVLGFIMKVDNGQISTAAKSCELAEPLIISDQLDKSVQKYRQTPGRPLSAGLCRNNIWQIFYVSSKILRFSWTFQLLDMRFYVFQ